MKFIIALVLLLLFFVLALSALLAWDLRADRAEWQRLAALQPEAPQQFSTSMIEDLPEPARRYFSFMIEPGTPLLPVAEIEMSGQFSLGNKDKPAYPRRTARRDAGSYPLGLRPLRCRGRCLDTCGPFARPRR